MSNPRLAWRETRRYKGSDGGKYAEFVLGGNARNGLLTIELDVRKGYRVRNVFVAPELMRRGYASEAYAALAAQSLKDTGHPLRSSEIGYERKSSKTTMSPDAVALWESFAQKGLAKKAGDYYVMDMSNPPLKGKKVGTVMFSELPDDMQVLISQFAEDFAPDSQAGAKNFDALRQTQFVIRELPTDLFPIVPVGGDDRGGKSYALKMKDVQWPVIVYGPALLDGRHRLFAARHYHRPSVRFIDLREAGQNLVVDGYYMGRVVRSNPAEYWGRSAAGCMFICPEDGTVLLLLRSQEVEQPGTWGISGGACGGDGFVRAERGSDVGEQEAAACAKRETKEEIGVFPSKFESGPIIEYRDKGFVYRTFVIFVPLAEKDYMSARIKLNWENDEWRWFGLDELDPRSHTLHFGVQHVLRRLRAKGK